MRMRLSHRFQIDIYKQHTSCGGCVDKPLLEDLLEAVIEVKSLSTSCDGYEQFGDWQVPVLRHQLPDLFKVRRRVQTNVLAVEIGM